MALPFNELVGSRLILGGHTFIEPLGSDPAASEDEQRAIVSACVESGICCVDTTYAPERCALARAMAAPVIRKRVRPIVWNFVGAIGDLLPQPVEWTDEVLAAALAELWPWSGQAIVVMHSLSDFTANRRQADAVIRWRDEGRIAAAGIWPGNWGGIWPADAGDSWDFVVYPWNPSSAAKHRPIFIAARERGIATVATSPFVRGWELDRIARRVIAIDGMNEAASRARVADALLRFAAFAPEVDHLIVAMRAARYVSLNLASLERGPLTDAEQRWLSERSAATP